LKLVVLVLVELIDKVEEKLVEVAEYQNEEVLSPEMGVLELVKEGEEVYGLILYR